MSDLIIKNWDLQGGGQIIDKSGKAIGMMTSVSINHRNNIQKLYSCGTDEPIGYISGPLEIHCCIELALSEFPTTTSEEFIDRNIGLRKIRL